MNVYTLSHENTFKPWIPPEEQDCYQQMLLADDDNTNRLIDCINNKGWFTGKSIADEWIPITVVVDEGTEMFPSGDYPFIPGFYSTPVLSLRAVEALQDLLEGNGELLPLKCESGSYFVFNVTCVVDALDESKSELKTLHEIDPDLFWKAAPHEMGVTKFAFNPEKITNLSIFRIPFTQTYRANIEFITDQFLQRIHLTDLQGFDFQLLWSSD